MNKPRVALYFTAVIVAAVAAVAVTVTWRRWQQPPLTVQLQVSGGSMAPRIAGEHFAATCQDCGWKYRCGVRFAPQAMISVCPNCGFQQNLQNEVQPGMQLKFAAVTPQWNPERFESVLFRHPEQPELLLIKRIMALPGERVSFAAGDLLINGSVLQKSLPQLQAMAIPVYSDKFRPDTPRWKSEAQWRVTPRGYSFQPDPGDGSGLAWLTYHHQRCYRSPQPRAPSAVTDTYGYNQGLSRSPRDVRDLLVTLQYRGSADLQVAFHTAARPVVLHCRGDKLHVTYDGRTLKQQPLTPNATAWQTLKFAICDGRAFWAVGETAGSVEIPPGFQSTTRPIRIGARGEQMEIQNVNILRDIYYEPAAVDAAGSADVSGYFLLGDNPPASTDSRHWPARVERGAIAGRLLR